MPPYRAPAEISALGGKASELPHMLYEARVSIVAALKKEGYTRRQIADALGMKLGGVHWCIKKARERGELRKGLEEALHTLDEEAVPLAIEGLLHHLRARDKDMVLGVLEGKGLLRAYSQVKNEGQTGAPSMAFQFNFQLPGGGTAAPTVEAVPKALSSEGTKQVFGVERDE